METPQHIKDEALEKFCSPHGKANPETYAYIAGRLASQKEMNEVRLIEFEKGVEFGCLASQKEIEELREEVEYLTRKKETIFVVLSNCAKRRFERIKTQNIELEELREENRKLKDGIKWATENPQSCFVFNELQKLLNE